MFEDCPPSKDGLPYVHWIYQLFGSCVYGFRGTASFLLGYATIACWLNAQFPQLITNYKNRSVDGLSLPFLLNWLLGDIANLIGCILTDQLPFQLYLASYFCTIDFALLFQYLYYRDLGENEDVDVDVDDPSLITGDDNSIDERTPIFRLDVKKSYTLPSRSRKAHERSASLVLCALFFFTFHAATILSPSDPNSVSSSHSTLPLRVVDAQDVDKHSVYPSPPTFLKIDGKVVGRIFAWTCTILYLSSRMPQIWMNYSRKSVEGLSIYMFIFAALGNLTYTLSIFTNPAASKDPLFLHKSLPYLLGATGTLTFDVTIYIQWWQYHGRKPRRQLTSHRSHGSFRSYRSYRSHRSYSSYRSHRSATDETGPSLLDPQWQVQPCA